MTPGCTLPSFKRRSLKHEIEFLVRGDLEPPLKRARFTNAPLTHSPVSVRTPDTQLNEFSILSHLAPTTTISCSECDFTAASAATIAAHARLCHPNKPYACGVCGRCFSEKGNMNKHHRTVHLKQRKHACGECGRTFAFLDGLNRHFSMVHLDRRPFQCTVCLCLVSHNSDVPCRNMCGMRFKQKSHHRRHVRSVHHIELPNE